MTKARIRKERVGKSYFWVITHPMCAVENYEYRHVNYEAWCASWDEAMCAFDKHRKVNVELGYVY